MDGWILLRAKLMVKQVKTSSRMTVDIQYMGVGSSVGYVCGPWLQRYML